MREKHYYIHAIRGGGWDSTLYWDLGINQAIEKIWLHAGWRWPGPNTCPDVECDRSSWWPAEMAPTPLPATPFLPFQMEFCPVYMGGELVGALLRSVASFQGDAR